MSRPADNAVQLQWNLDRTIHKSLNVALDFVRVAAQDNVQPIALMACEGFGNTLPICQVTRSVVEKKTRPKQEPILLRFAKISICKGGGETLERLFSNVAGLNFLALAAALVPIMMIDEAGIAIHKMLDKSAVDKTLVPPAYHVQAILELLEPQLNQIGFVETCYQWDHWLRNHITPYHDTQHRYPSSNSMGHLVSALRSLARLGHESIDSIVITCHSCTAWIAAFVEWCLGLPPSVLYDSNTVVFAQPESKVTILVPSERKITDPIKVESYQASGALFDMICIDASQDHNGQPGIFSAMTTLQVHAQQTIQSLTDSSLEVRALLEALSYGILHARALIGTPTQGDTLRDCPPEIDLPFENAQCTRYFPDKRMLYSAMSNYLGPYAKDVKRFQKLPLGTTGMSNSFLPSPEFPCTTEQANEYHGIKC